MKMCWDGSRERNQKAARINGDGYRAKIEQGRLLWGSV